ncbi:MAG TPA: DUF4421 family protein [Chitinophagaceae bacterium]|nr:DUF4421 family protein [Chitinophagaceae bacterium]
MPTVYSHKILFKKSLPPLSKRGKGWLFSYPLFFIVGITSFCPATAQFAIDSSYIKRFEKENDVEVYTGLTKTSFRFRQFANDNFISQHKLFANTSAYTGFTLDYNWLSIGFSKNIPNTSVAKQSTSIKAVSIHLRKSHEKFLFEAGTDKYRGLILQVSRRQGEYKYYDDLNYRSYFTRITYIFNAERFSLNAARNYSLLQAKSAGSFMAIVSPFFQRFTLKGGSGEFEESDSVFLSEINKKPSSINLLVSGGYTYNFIFNDGDWSINPGIFMGPAVRKNLEPKEGQSLKLIANYQLVLNGGYNGQHFYFHVNAVYNNNTYHLMNSKMSIRNREISLTCGYRMGKLKNKILGVL